MIEASNISMALEEGMPGNRDGLVAAAARALSVEPDDISEVVLPTEPHRDSHQAHLGG